jgi:hypothetical protein
MPAQRHTSHTRSTPSQRRRHRYVVCLANDGLEVSLAVGKIYRVLRDAHAEAHGLVRVVDETDEDYLFPADLFEAIPVSPRLARALRAAG